MKHYQVLNETSVPFQKINGLLVLTETLSNLLSGGCLQSAYLLVGPDSIGFRLSRLSLARLHQDLLDGGRLDGRQNAHTVGIDEVAANNDIEL